MIVLNVFHAGSEPLIRRVDEEISAKQ